MQRLPKPFPAWAGFIFVGVIFLAEVFDVALRHGVMIATYASAVAAYAYYLTCVFRLHRIVEIGSDGSFRNKPWKVVGISLIPLFGFFYAVMWPIELASYLQPNGVKMNGIAPGVCLLLSFALLRLDSVLGFIAVFSVLIYLTRCVSAYRFTKEIAPDFDAISAGV